MKISTISKWSVLPILLTLMAVSSCKKNFLDRRPLGRLTDEDIEAGTFDGKVFAAYAQLRKGGFNHHLYLGITSYRSDESMKGSSTSDGSNAEKMYDDFDYTATDGGIQEFWTDHYSLIIATNEIISDIDSLGAQDPNTLINRAEAKFLRAYSFFELTRAFGRVPKIDFKVYDPADVNIKKVDDVNEIFTLIDADLTEAEGTLPVNWDPPYSEGRLTKGAAYALHARTQLWRSNWAMGLAAAKAVIDLGRYSLVPDYGSQFRKTGENGPESIFEIQAYYTPTQDLGIIYSNVQGVRGAGNWDLGWGWNVPTQKLVDEYEEGDPRRVET
ncbi:MAG TPA: RagB/SusD family nutrient uptake outer membrane protein, partial [Flavitalea sp.]|nr:RagB/SusD family nutrient uptake outer membrane protein [Flavitalea sp.]